MTDIKEDPLFSFRNFFRPTENNVLGWATVIKGLSVTGMATAFATANPYIFYGFMVIGGIAEAFIYFTSKKPVAVIEQALDNVVEDIKLEQTNHAE